VLRLLQTRLDSNGRTLWLGVNPLTFAPRPAPLLMDCCIQSCGSNNVTQHEGERHKIVIRDQRDNDIKLIQTDETRRQACVRSFAPLLIRTESGNFEVSCDT
jgi:hypothetical protein